MKVKYEIQDALLCLRQTDPIVDQIGEKLPPLKLQARPLNVAPVTVPDEIWKRRPGLRGHPGGIGWATRTNTDPN